jgi:hypothetical protein
MLLLTVTVTDCAVITTTEHMLLHERLRHTTLQMAHVTTNINAVEEHHDAYSYIWHTCGESYSRKFHYNSLNAVE